jgi:NAD(P)H-hydrate epimerase
MIVTCGQMQAAESAVFATGIEARDLMEQAGRGCAEAIRQFFPRPGHAVLFVGTGHNGEDALVAGRCLRSRGWHVTARCAVAPDQFAPLTRSQWERFQAEPDPGEPGTGVTVAVDGLLGIGARGPMRDFLIPFADEMRDCRSRGAWVFALDLPSGLDGDTGEPYAGAVAADVTLAISHVKTGLLEDRAIDHVGRLVCIPLPDLAVAKGDSSRITLHASGMQDWWPVRPFSLHKSAAGRVGIIAGSPGMTGAACLAALGALRAGAGLVTVFCCREVYPVIAAQAPLEAMVRPLDTVNEIAALNFHALGIGPGLGAKAATVRSLVLQSPLPAVIDADSLNDLARAGGLELLGDSAPRRLLTPHPGELERLWPGAMAASRLETTRAVVERHGVTLLHKGARTLIAAPGRPVAANTTGHPGMATGGIGDVLTGVCTALLAGGLGTYEAACLGSWLIGRAAERALLPDRAPEGIVAGDVAAHLPEAIHDFRRGAY